MFITFEGPEGSGKSANAAWLRADLEAQGRRVVAAREPGGTPLGEAIRPLLLGGPEPPVGYPALFLFAAARAELIARTIRPALAGGADVICDRFTDSTLAYQGYGDGLPLPIIRQVNAIATGGLVPDLTILLDLDVALGLRRKQGQEWNVFDDRDLAFHGAVRAGFLAMAAEDPGRWLVVDAAQPLPAVRAAIHSRLALLSLSNRASG